ncbi:MAG: hypothetical protein JWM47_3482 [Acidimicrobiales bacterium]|nr:hypothetical protein [Acidimicrobiales bacterium]
MVARRPTPRPAASCTRVYHRAVARPPRPSRPPRPNRRPAPRERPDRPALLEQALDLRSIDARGPDPAAGTGTPADEPPSTTSTTSTTSAERLGIRELRGRLASLVRRAGSGERIVITVGGRPVAQLGPVEPSGTPTIDDLVARGLLEPARRGDRPADPDVSVDSWTGRRLDRALREVRGT